jgi:threonine synthase
MLFYSTNNRTKTFSLKEAVMKGLPEDKGLFMPTGWPRMSSQFIAEIENMSFNEIAYQVSHCLLHDDIPDDVLRKIIEDAYDFEAPVVHLHDNIYVLELFHGPTLAFKDFGAKFMSRLMAYLIDKQQKELHVLVATSGDTGSAVANGFYKVPGVKVTVLYPSGMVSDIQEKQFTTLGENITAIEIEGTFDDCQTLVKQAFLDDEINKKINLTSANSINISRLIPQTFYYFSAYAQLKKYVKPITVSVPSGNFGNLCAGLIAKKMGLPFFNFVASTNKNDIVPKYLLDGIFEAKPSVQTVSNAMDVGNPSNFVRMLELYNGSLSLIKGDISGASFSDGETLEAVEDIYQKTGYILDPHSAVGYLGLRKYMVNQDGVGVFLSTAHPAKFKDVVDEIIKKPVEIPERLKKFLEREKEAILMKNSFSKLKSYLLGKKV